MYVCIIVSVKKPNLHPWIHTWILSTLWVQTFDITIMLRSLVDESLIYISTFHIVVSAAPLMYFVLGDENCKLHFPCELACENAGVLYLMSL